MYRRAAEYLDRILKGARPTELPVEQPDTFEFIVNTRTAEELGLSFPPDVYGGDRVVVSGVASRCVDDGAER